MNTDGLATRRRNWSWWAIAIVIVLYIPQNNRPFFGDHVTLVSHPANYFYDNHFSDLIIPSDYDTGHPPLLPVIVASWWEVMGRSLGSTHFLFFIFLLPLVFQFYLLVKKILPEKEIVFAVILFLLFPVVLAEYAAMSVDVFLCLFFLLGINAVLSGKRMWLFVAVMLSLLMSLRGIMISGTLFFFDILHEKNNLKECVRKLPVYFFAAIPFLTWELFHHSQTGWWLSSPDSPWQAGRQFATGKYFGEKIAEYGFRFCESGMLLPWICILLYFLKFRRSEKTDEKEKMRRMYLLLATGIVFFSLFLLPFKNPILIRYILCLQVIVIIIFTRFLFSLKAMARNILFGAAALFFIASNFFVYPVINGKRIAYNWGDGSLAHLPYFKFREETKDFIEKNHIDPGDVYTSFPEYKSFKDTNLKENDFCYRTMNTDSLKFYLYVIYSNVMNEVPLSTEKELLTHWQILQEHHSLTVQYYLFKNPAVK